MNSVIAYKQFSLGEGLADLFASEIKNLETFKASVTNSAKDIRALFGFNQCFSESTYDRDSFNQKTGSTKDC